MATIHRFEDLDCWKKAREVAKLIYHIASQVPLANDYALRNQLNSSAGSIMDNIAEGFERNGNKEFIHFLTIVKASAGETRSQLYRVYDRNYMQEEALKDLFQKVKELSSSIQGLINYLKNSDLKGSKYVKEGFAGYNENESRDFYIE